MTTKITTFAYGWAPNICELSFIIYKDIDCKEKRIVKYRHKDAESIITNMDEIPVSLKKMIGYRKDLDMYETLYLIYAHLHRIGDRIHVIRFRRRGRINTLGSYDLYFKSINSGDSFAVRIIRLNLRMIPQISESHIDYDYEFISNIKNGSLTQFNNEQNELIKYYRIRLIERDDKKEIKESKPPDNFHEIKKIIKNNIIPNNRWEVDYIKNMKQDDIYLYYYIMHQLLKRTKEYLTSYLSKMDTYLNKNLCAIIADYTIESSNHPKEETTEAIIRKDKLLL